MRRCLRLLSMSRYMLQSLVAPVTILAASCWTASMSFLSSLLHLSQTISAYSSRGLMKVIYILSKVERETTRLVDVWGYVRLPFAIWCEGYSNACMGAYLRYGNVVEIKGRVMLFLMFTRKNNRFSLRRIKSYKPFLRPGWYLGQIKVWDGCRSYRIFNNNVKTGIICE